MKAIIEIRMDNTAFEDEPATELGKILRNLATEIEFGRLAPIPLSDRNGNIVGLFTIKED